MIAYILAPLKFYNYVIIYPQAWKHLEYQNFLGNLERIVFCKELVFFTIMCYFVHVNVSQVTAFVFVLGD